MHWLKLPPGEICYEILNNILQSTIQEDQNK